MSIVGGNERNTDTLSSCERTGVQHLVNPYTTILLCVGFVSRTSAGSGLVGGKVSL